MKKLFFAFAAGLLLLAGCAKEYDDTALKEKVDALDKKVTALQAEVDKLKGDVSGLSTVVEAWKNADVITKVDEIKEGDKVTGYTLTFKSGKTISLFNGKDGTNGTNGTSPVIGTKEEGDVLYWTVNGEFLLNGGKKVPVNVVPSFELKDGHLWVTIGGVAQDLGPVSEGSSVDGIIKSIVPGEKTVVITLNGDPGEVIELLKAMPFGFVFEQTAFAVLSTDPINIPYTLNGKTEKTTLGVFTNANYTAEIDDAKVVVTPPAAGVKGEVLVWAANHEGQSDIAQLTFGPKEYQNTDAAPEDPENIYEDDVDYIAEATNGAVAAHVTTNVEIAVKSEAEWITVGEITKASYTINLVLEDNPKDVIRYGNVKVVLKNDENVVLQDIKIAQAAGEPQDAQGKWVLATNNPEMYSHVLISEDDAFKNLTNYTFEVRFYANDLKKGNKEVVRMLRLCDGVDYPNQLLVRFANGNDGAGVLNLETSGKNQSFKDHVFAEKVWTTLSIACNGSTVTVYDNGEKVGEMAVTGKIMANYFELGMSMLGHRSQQAFDGYFDYIRLWNVARSESEIKANLCADAIAGTEEGLLANFVFEAAGEKPGYVIKDEAHNLELDFSKASRDASSATDSKGQPYDASAIVANQWFDYTEVICESSVTPEPVQFDPSNFAALDWSKKEAAAWYKFAENYDLPDGFTYIIHIYPYTLNTSGMRIGNFGKNTESPCNMLRFGQNGNNAELEWMVDTGAGRKEKELLAPGFVTEKWQAVVLTADKASGEYKMYRDGELQVTKTYTYNDAMGFGGIEFANSWSSAWRSAFNGRIALISIYDKALTAEEVKENIFTVPVSENCVGFWSMTEGEGGLLKADKSRAIKEDIDLTKVTRSADEADNYEVIDVTSHVTWTTGNKIGGGDTPEPPTPTEYKVDVLNNAFTGIDNSSTSYQDWANKKGSESDAVYAGQTARGAAADNLSIQFRVKNNNSGIITTASGGKLKKIEVKFNSSTADRILNVYGKNEAYSAPTDLYDASKAGTLIGEIQAGTGNYSIDVTGDYTFVGFRAKDNPIYVDEIKVSWEPAGEEPGPQLQEGKATVFNKSMFGVTFPEEYAALDNCSFEGWVYPKSYSGAEAGLPTFMGTENAFLVRFTNKKPQIILGDPVTGVGEKKASSNAEVPVNEWHHIAATYARNGKAILYVDGMKVAEHVTYDKPVTFNSGKAASASSDDSVIGRVFWVGNAYGERWFNGNMSHIRVWNKTLTVEEVRASANNKALKTAENLIANWPLTEVEGVTVNDISGNGFNTVYKTYDNTHDPVIYEVESVAHEDAVLPELSFATAIEISAPATEIYRGESVSLSVKAVPEGASMPAISWKSGDEGIATVDNNGLVKGVAAGTVTITAENEEEGLSDTVDITVKNFEAGNCTPDFSVNMNSLAIDWGSVDVSALNQLTVEWKMKANAWSNSYKYKSWGWEYTETTKVNSVFGVEGTWLLRIGDANIDNNNLELAGHNHPRANYDFKVGEWYHVAVTYNVADGKTAFYVNGALVNEVGETATEAANLTGAKISESYKDNSVNSRFFNGALADLRVWKSIRTVQEINNGINEFNDASNENLLLYLKLDEGTNTVVNSANTDATVTPSAELGWGGGRPSITPEPLPAGPTYTDLSDKQANCYVIEEAGAYKIPALKGNGTESVGTVASAAIVWETYNNAEEVTANSVVAKVGVEEGFITFETPATLKPGNALIAAKDAEGKILWSWHIWVPASKIADIDNGIHTTPMMDRNLGALDVAVASADAKINVNTMGMWYQWGRKDPFPGPSSIDTEGQYPGFASVAGTAIEAKKIQLSLEESIQQPTVFARGLYVDDVLTDYDWKSGDHDGTLWGDKGDGTRTTIEDKSIYDPCPAGYRVPARDRKNADESDTDPNKMWAADLANGAGWNYNATNYWFTFGNPAAVFPAAGYCDGGTAKTTFRTCLWNAHHDGDGPGSAYCLYVYLSSGAPKFANYSHGKSRGYYVRCCK